MNFKPARSQKLWHEVGMSEYVLARRSNNSSIIVDWRDLKEYIANKEVKQRDAPKNDSKKTNVNDIEMSKPKFKEN